MGASESVLRRRGVANFWERTSILMQATLGELAVLVHGRAVGDENLTIHGAETLRDVTDGQITLMDSAERAGKLANTPAAAVVVRGEVDSITLPRIEVEDVHLAFSEIVALFRPPRKSCHSGVSPQAVISPSAVLGEDVNVHPLAVIGDDVRIGRGTTIHSGARIMDGSRIGPDVTIFPNAVLYETTIVGPRCVIHAGAVLGAWGFGYDSSSGRHVLSAQLGNVVLEADVEIGANTTIDRGTYNSTVIGEGAKIDNQVMIGHNCWIGRHNMLCAQVGIAGSTSTGDYVVMAGQVGVRDNVHIGKQAVLGGMAGVISDVPEGARLVGIPATPERDQMIKQATLNKLPAMRRQLKKLQAVVDGLVAEKVSVGE